MDNNTVTPESKVSIPSISIPTRSIWSLVGLLLICGFGYLQFIHFLTPGFTEIFSYSENNPMDLPTWMRLMWVPIIAYVIIGTGVALLVNIFKKLKSFKEGALVAYLLTSLSFSVFLMSFLIFLPRMTSLIFYFLAPVLILYFGYQGIVAEIKSNKDS